MAQQGTSVVVVSQPGVEEKPEDEGKDKAKRPPPIHDLIWRRSEEWHTAICSCFDDLYGCALDIAIAMYSLSICFCQVFDMIASQVLGACSGIQ